MNDFATPDLHSRLATVFPALDDEALRALEPHLTRVHLAGGNVLFRRDDSGDAMYVVVTGELDITHEAADGASVLVNRVGPGESVGEMALLTGQPRTATVVARTDSDLVRLPKDAFDSLAGERPEVIRDLARSVVPRFRSTQLRDVLIRLFGRLNIAALHDLQSRVEWLSLSSGDVLIRQGEPGEAMFIVICGRLRVVTVNDDGDERVLREVGAGQSLGEFSLLTDEPRSATAYAIRDTTVVKLCRAAFEQIMERYPRGLMEMTRLIVRQRYGAAPGAELEGGSTLALVPVGRSVRLDEFARRVADALSAFGPTAHLSCAEVDRLFGKAGIAQLPEDHPIHASLHAWLDDREREHRYVIYQADAGWSNWTQRCVRQADRILFVGDADGDSEPGEIEQALVRSAAKGRRELVLIQANGCSHPSGTRRWLERRQVSAHYHVRMNNTSDLERLARRLTGRARGLVLGGGGARGFAHVGVYRALVEAGIPIDFVGGTSMGAVLGACIAMRHDYEVITGFAGRLSSPFKVFDPTLPVVSLFSSEKVTASLRSVYEDTHIEDLWCPYFCVSSNLTRAVETVHRDGEVWKAVRASMAIPGIFSPVLCNGELHVDGAVLNNLPIDVMSQLNPGGPIVAVNVVPEVDLTTPYRFGPSISGSRALLSKVLPVDTVSVPWIFENLIRVVELNDVHRARVKQRLASIYIRPPVGRFGILDFKAWREIVDVGYSVALDALGRSHADPVETREAPVTPEQVVHSLQRALDGLEQLIDESRIDDLPSTAQRRDPLRVGVPTEA